MPSISLRKNDFYKKNLTSEQQFIKKVGTAPSPLPLQINATLHKIDKSKHTYMNCQPFKVFLCIKYNV
jgi:hypothetical protein